MYKNLVVSGGGLYALSFLGCLRCLEENNQIKSISNFIGTSAGSLICTALAIGYTHQELSQVIKEVLVSTEDVSLNIEVLFNLYEEYGIDNGEKIQKIARIMLERKNVSTNFTFLNLAKTFGKNLVITGSNLTLNKLEYFCVDNTPEMEIVEAICISCSIPLIFTPRTYKDNLYVDGGIYNNFPMDYVAEHDPTHDKTTLGMVIEHPIKPITSIWSYIYSIVNCLLISQSTTKKYNPENVCLIPTTENVELSMGNLLSLSITLETLSDLETTGYNRMKEYLEIKKINTPINII
jgi:predicted acylesterase/phospholipase RssA